MNEGRYDDIIDLECPVSEIHPHMARSERAKQFSPFAALKGYDEAISDKERIFQKRSDLSDDERRIIDEHFTSLSSGYENARVTVLRFLPVIDENTGYRERVSGMVDKIDTDNRLITVDGIRIPFEDIEKFEVDASSSHPV